jgi:hypothetical protein
MEEQINDTNKYLETKDNKVMQEDKSNKVLKVNDKNTMYNKIMMAYVVSIFILLLFTIYSEVIILKISQEFSNSQPTNAILLFILELIGCIGLFFIEIGIIEKKNLFVSTTICVLSIVLTMIWVPRGFAYKDVFNYIMDNKNSVQTIGHNYNNLKNNLIASTALHSASVIFNFITVFMVAYYKNKYNIDEISKV